jgi:outer membrane lipoprotein-sorting protein
MLAVAPLSGWIVQVAKAQAAPKTGQEVLQRMHDKYSGKWYHTLTFTQQTEVHRQDGTTQTQTWYESLRHSADGGTRLRIDFGDPAGGNGALYTADSLYSVRKGKVVSAEGEGNEFLPLIEGVYVQPVERTIRDLAGMKVDLNQVASGAWQGRPAWIVGSTADDVSKPQFWVDRDRLVVTRMVIKYKELLLDIDLGGYAAVGPAWLATRIVMTSGGKPLQSEEYSGWKTNIELPASLFDPAQWSTAPHWVRPR